MAKQKPDAEPIQTTLAEREIGSIQQVVNEDGRHCTLNFFDLDGVLIDDYRYSSKLASEEYAAGFGAKFNKEGWWYADAKKVK